MNAPRPKCVYLGGVSALLSVALTVSAFAQSDAEKRRQEFEAAMRAVEDAEKKLSTEATAAAAERALVDAQDKMRASVSEQAKTAPAEFNAVDKKRADAQAFAGQVADKVQPELREKFTQPAPVEAAPLPAPPGGIPVKDKDLPAERPVAEAKPVEKAETIIDADGQLIFDGSGKFGDAYRVVIFEENVRLQHPEFLMNSDKLVAVFKDAPAELPTPGALDALATEEEAGGGSQLERAVATGREVTVTQNMASGEPQIAKARRATYFADREEVLLEIWPQVQRGDNLVIAKSAETVIILKGEEMIVRGPVRTKIVGKAAAGAVPEKKGKSTTAKSTVIDAERGAVFNRPSKTSGHKEIFFEGNVNVADPGFDMVGGDSLTAYTRPNSKTGETEMTKAVMRGSKVEVKERVGEERYGTARMVTYTPATGDLRLTGYPEIFDGIQHKSYDTASASISLNEKTKKVSGRDTGGGRTKMSFTPGMQPPG